MTAVNVWIVGFSAAVAENMQDFVNILLQDSGDAHGSVTTVINADVKCTEHIEKDEPYVRVYSDDIEGAKRVAGNICKNLKVAVEYAEIAGVFVPEE